MSDVADNIGRIAKKHPTYMEMTQEDALIQIKKLICRFEIEGD